MLILIIYLKAEAISHLSVHHTKLTQAQRYGTDKGRAV